MSGLFCLGCRKDINLLVVSLGKFLLLAGQQSVLILLMAGGCALAISDAALVVSSFVACFTSMRWVCGIVMLCFVKNLLHILDSRHLACNLFCVLVYVERVVTTLFRSALSQ